jgi:hypothetical protein
MGVSTNIAMNEKKRPELTPCQEHIEEAMVELRQALTSLDKLPHGSSDNERKSLEADICLASRSAYFGFYTWVVLNSEIDEPAAQELDECFQRALNAMQPGEFRTSVEERYQDFKQQCDRVRGGDNDPSTVEPTPVSSF